MGTLDYSDFRVAAGTMGFKHRALEAEKVRASLAAPSYLLKIIPQVDRTLRICELVRYCLTDIRIKDAWSGPCALDLHDHALAPVADLPVLEALPKHSGRPHAAAGQRGPQLPGSLSHGAARSRLANSCQFG